MNNFHFVICLNPHLIEVKNQLAKRILECDNIMNQELIVVFI